jgi:hypothetical protein
MVTRAFSRREFLAGAGVLLVATACGGGGSSPKPIPPAPGTIGELLQGAQRGSLLSSDTPVKPGKITFAFDLTTQTGGVVTGGGPQVHVAPNATARVLGPFPATWYEFTAYDKTHDRSPRSQLPGTYSVDLDIPSSGNWQVAVAGDSGSAKAVWTGTLFVTDGPVPAEIGSKAISVRTPVATTEAKLKQICTREPPDHMHAISLDMALKNGKPTVVSFATPLLCESQLCGPVVDEQLLASEETGPGKANFIHVEEFLPGPDLKPPPPTAENASPAFKAWKFQSEPWVVVIDRGGIIRARFEGPVVAAQIEQALQPLL